LIGFRLHALGSGGKTPPACFPKKPKPVRWRFSIRGQKRSFAHGILENLLCLRFLTDHEETKAIELREITPGHGEERERMILRAASVLLKLQPAPVAQTPRHFLGVFAAIESGDAEKAFSL
jgi:hypothetical protein